MRRLNPLQGLKFDGTIWSNEHLCIQSRAKNGCELDCKWVKMLSPILAMCQLAMWAENSVKIELNSVIKTKRKPSKNKVGMEWKTQ